MRDLSPEDDVADARPGIRSPVPDAFRDGLTPAAAGFRRGVAAMVKSRRTRMAACIMDARPRVLPCGITLPSNGKPGEPALGEAWAP